jgi:RNA polymerase sigma-70 factor (ECF subfamily)
MMLKDDSIIINRILAGNTREYAILIDRYKDLAFTIAFRVLNNREDAEEIAQDAFVKAFQSLGKFRQDSGFSTWLYRIVYNTAISKKRIRKPVSQNIETIVPIKDNFDETLEEMELTAENTVKLEKAMGKISEEERVLITLYYLNQSGIEEIQHITGLSKSNVKVKLFRARKKLQELTGCITEKTYI